MPMYEYECGECHRRTEKIQKFSDAPLTVCPYCGGPLERTITAAAFSFAGGGWYKDGYGSAKPPSAAAEGGAPAAAPAAGSSSAESAPAPTPSGSSPAPAAAPAASASPAPSKAAAKS
jgi:putative FmdB family regulatory protein